MYPVYRKTQSLKYSQPFHPSPTPSMKTIFQSPSRPVLDSPFFHTKLQPTSTNILPPPTPRLTYHTSTPSTTSTTSSPQSQTTLQPLSSSGSRFPSPVELSEMLPAIRQLEIRVVSLSEAVLHHQKLLNQLESTKSIVSPFNTTIDSSGNSQHNLENRQIVSDIVKLINQQLEKRREEERVTKIKEREGEMWNYGKVLVQIEKVREEIGRQVNKRMEESRGQMGRILKKETESQIISMYEVNRQVFRRIEVDMNELRELIQKSKSISPSPSPFVSIRSPIQPSSALPSIFSSSRKFLNDPCILRYRQVLERVRLPSSSSSQSPSLSSSNPNIRIGPQCQQYQSVSDPIILNQVIYYLDGDYCLLDDQFNYIVDGNGESVKLGERDVEMLREGGIIKE